MATDVALDNTTPSLVLHSMSSATPGTFTQVRVAGCPTISGIEGDTLTSTPKKIIKELVMHGKMVIPKSHSIVMIVENMHYKI